MGVRRLIDMLFAATALPLALIIAANGFGAVLALLVSRRARRAG